MVLFEAISKLNCDITHFIGKFYDGTAAVSATLCYENGLNYLPEMLIEWMDEE